MKPQPNEDKQYEAQGATDRKASSKGHLQNGAAKHADVESSVIKQERDK